MWKRQTAAGGGAGLVLASHGAYARGHLLRGATRMDNQSDSVCIEPLETTALSADEETETQTPISAEGDINWGGPGFYFQFDIRRRGRGRTIKGGVVRLPPELLRAQGLTIVCPQTCKNLWSPNPRKFDPPRLGLPRPLIR
jgi:hypothetical protein